MVGRLFWSGQSAHGGFDRCIMVIWRTSSKTVFVVSAILLRTPLRSLCAARFRMISVLIFIWFRSLSILPTVSPLLTAFQARSLELVAWVVLGSVGLGVAFHQVRTPAALVNTFSLVCLWRLGRLCIFVMVLGRYRPGDRVNVGGLLGPIGDDCSLNEARRSDPAMLEISRVV